MTKRPFPTIRNITLTEENRLHAVLSIIALICIAVTLVELILFAAASLVYGIFIELIYLGLFMFAFWRGRKCSNRTSANILSLFYLSNIVATSLIIFPGEYGFHFFFLVVPPAVLILFGRGKAERWIYTVAALALFYAAQFGLRFPPLETALGTAPLFHTLTIALFALAAMTSSWVYSLFVHNDTDNLSRIALTDSLTNLENRLSFDSSGEFDFTQMKREEKDMGVLMMDLDHFKKINDFYGHDAGDALLRALGKTLKSCVRSADRIARYGGEEFVALLKGSGPTDSLRIAEEIRKNVEAMAVPDYKEIKVTISIGVSHLEAEDSDLREAVRRADKALYYAKDAGRNCVKDDQNSSVFLVEG